MDRLCIALVAVGEDLWGVEKIRLALSSAGYKVLAIENWETIDIPAWNKPSLIIASLAGSRSEDLSLCKLLARRGDAPVVVVSSQVEESQQLDLFEAGVTDFLTHPVNPRELLARIHNILQRTQPPLPSIGTAAIADISSEIDQNRNRPFSKIVRGITKRFTRLPH